MKETHRRVVAAVAALAGLLLVVLSMAADELGLGSQNGTFGAWQFIGVTVGLFGLFVAGGLRFSDRPSGTISGAMLASVLVAIAVSVAFINLADPTVCPDCSNPNARESTLCETWNPTTAGNFSTLACDL